MNHIIKNRNININLSSSNQNKMVTCPICQDEKPKSDMLNSINCTHKVCNNCFKMASESNAPITKCPLCRKTFSFLQDNTPILSPPRVHRHSQSVRRRLNFNEIDDEIQQIIPIASPTNYDIIRTTGYISNSFWELSESDRNIILEQQVLEGRNIRILQDIQYSLYIPLTFNENMFLENCSTRKLQRLWRNYKQKRLNRNKTIQDDLWVLQLSQVEKEFLGIN